VAWDPSYLAVAAAALDEITQLARSATVDMATMLGIDPLVIEMAFETAAQWETTAATRADSDTCMYLRRFLLH
jgi:hypothetical protein